MTNSLRGQKAACLRGNGLSYRSIADELGVCVGRARELVRTGQVAPEPDEIVFMSMVMIDTPVRKLPVDKMVRKALQEAGVSSFGSLMQADPSWIRKTILRYPNLGRKKLEDLERLQANWEGSREIEEPFHSAIVTRPAGEILEPAHLSQVPEDALQQDNFIDA